MLNRFNIMQIQAKGKHTEVNIERKKHLQFVENRVAMREKICTQRIFNSYRADNERTVKMVTASWIKYFFGWNGKHSNERA